MQIRSALLFDTSLLAVLFVSILASEIVVTCVRFYCR